MPAGALRLISSLLSYSEDTTMTSASPMTATARRSRPEGRSPSTTDESTNRRTSPDKNRPWAAAIGSAR